MLVWLWFEANCKFASFFAETDFAEIPAFALALGTLAFFEVPIKDFF